MKRRRSVIASEEFLQTEDGRRFARSMVQEMIRQSDAAHQQVTADDPVSAWDELLKEFCEHLHHDIVDWEGEFDETAMRGALAECYHERFFELYPKDDRAAAAEYVLRLTRLVRWLARLTCEVWLLHHRKDSDYPTKNPEKKVRVYYLHWARETFGWWRAQVDRFIGDRLKLPRPCRCTPDRTTEALLKALDPPLRAQLEAFQSQMLAQEEDLPIVEVEQGCPLC